MNPAGRVQLEAPFFRPLFALGRGARGLSFDSKAGYVRFLSCGFYGLGDLNLGHIF